MTHRPALPQRNRRYHGDIADSARWDAISLRKGDIIVCSPPKSGTSWTQSICALLIFGDPEVDVGISARSPWIDNWHRPIEDVVARLSAQTHRRYMKTHTPLDGIPFDPGVTYLVPYRHPLDVHFSMRRHNENMDVDWIDKFYPDDLDAGLELFLATDEDTGQDQPGLAYLVHHFLTYSAWVHLPNVHLMHYANMCADLEGHMRALCDLLEIWPPEPLFDQLVRAASFDNMKSNAARFVPSGNTGFWRDEAAFFDSASHRKWDGKLSDASLEAYNTAIGKLLSPEQRAWLEWGVGVP